MSVKHQTYADYLSMSGAVARVIADSLKNNPELVLCMASGHTPTSTCEQLVNLITGEKIDHSRLTFIGLDEWVGLKPDNTGSCRYYFEKMLIDPLSLSPNQYHLFDGTSSYLETECSKMDAVISKKSIDIMVVGIGMNGHIGFNEPGTPVDILCHVADLEATTISVGQKYFDEATTLNQGITVGLGHLMRSHQLVLLANGERKKEVTRRAIQGPVDVAFPASIVQMHSNALVITDFSV